MRRRLIDADEFSRRMYSAAFEEDSDMQKWDSGCWIRYKLFEQILDQQPIIESTAQPEETETRPISFEDCSVALVEMWMDNVVTDGEYKRIMGRLIAHEKAERRCKE